MISNSEKPFYILEGENSIRYFSIILLTFILLFATFSIHFLGYGMLVFIFAALFVIISIRFPKISLFENHFVIEKKCLIAKYSDRDSFKYDTIKSVAFIGDNSNQSQFIKQTFYTQRSYGIYPKPDQMVITLKNDTTRVFYRIGNKDQFIEAVTLINRKIIPATNSRLEK
jgi:hypothetical protein